jgi:hypothetical protein
MTTPTIPTIDPGFKSLIPPLAADEFAQLEQNIVESGICQDAILIWNSTIIDGHNRFAICSARGIEFQVREIDFATRDNAKLWILQNQLARRNLTDAARIKIALKKADLLKSSAKENQ